MRVLFIEAYPGWRGAQRSLTALAVSLAGEVEPEVLCTTAGRSAERYRQAGLPVRLLPAPASLDVFGGTLSAAPLHRRLFAALGGALPFSLRLGRELARRRPDVVHCNQARGVLLAGPAAASLGIPLVWHMRGANTLGGLSNLAAHRLSDRIICVSRALTAGVRKASLGKCVVIHNGISASERPAGDRVEAARRRIGRIKARLGLDADAVTLITASSFVPYKGLHHLASALDILMTTDANLSRRVLWIALGDSEGHAAQARYRSELQSRLGGETDRSANVFFEGATDEATAWIAAADVAVLPTVEREAFRYSDGEEVAVEGSEGFPRTVLESMLVGVPVVASGVSGVEEQIVDEESGLVVPAGDGRALAGALHRLIGDGELRRRLAREAQRKVEAFSTELMAEKVIEVYEELTASGREQGRGRS